jgi:hypothetical protein
MIMKTVILRTVLTIFIFVALLFLSQLILFHDWNPGDWMTDYVVMPLKFFSFLLFSSSPGIAVIYLFRRKIIRQGELYLGLAMAAVPFIFLTRSVLFSNNAWEIVRLFVISISNFAVYCSIWKFAKDNN